MRNGFVREICGRRFAAGGCRGKAAAMKIHVDVDCTPEEARVFLGLPDVVPLQAALMEELEKRMMAKLQAMEPDQRFKTWLPAGLQGWEQLPKAFWTQMSTAASAKKKEGK